MRFREAGGDAHRKPSPADFKAFPELEGFEWPKRGSDAEWKSLTFQAGGFTRTAAPDNLGESIDRLILQYPKSRPRRSLRGEEWEEEEIAQAVSEIAQREVNRKASPGVPLSVLSVTNAGIIDRHMSLLQAAVCQRLELLSKFDLSSCPSPEFLVEAGLCDPVRLFVKQEPHKLAKVLQGRFRLISSVSLVDQLVERMIFGPQNQLEISLWKGCPSKPGMGLSTADQVASVWEDLRWKHHSHPAAEADISGFDWSVQDWELWADWEMRVRLGGFGKKLSMAARNRYYCFMNSVFQLSNGTLVSQQLPGLMKSGSYNTSSTNSRIRCLMAAIIGSPWCIAMGDDSVEGYMAGAQKEYLRLGHVCKEYMPCNADGEKLLDFNFCSHFISAQRCYLTTWAKTLYRFLSSDVENVEDLEVELGSCPEWFRIEKYVRCGRREVGHKIIEENGEKKEGWLQADERREPLSTDKGLDVRACGPDRQPKETEEKSEQTKNEWFSNYPCGDITSQCWHDDVPQCPIS